MRQERCSTRAAAPVYRRLLAANGAMLGGDPQRRPLLGDVELVLEAISQQQQEAAHTQESQQLSESICSSQQQQTSGYGYTPCRPIVPTKDKYEMAVPVSELSVSTE
ncbi:hypothetical protein MTO96_019512 [Rhipicephalus appendiculatus]